jgi:hypothetical protein
MLLNGINIGNIFVTIKRVRIYCAVYRFIIILIDILYIICSNFISKKIKFCVFNLFFSKENVI